MRGTPLILLSLFAASHALAQPSAMFQLQLPPGAPAPAPAPAPVAAPAEQKPALPSAGEPAIVQPPVIAVEQGSTTEPQGVIVVPAVQTVEEPQAPAPQTEPCKIFKPVIDDLATQTKAQAWAARFGTLELELSDDLVTQRAMLARIYQALSTQGRDSSIIAALKAMHQSRSVVANGNGRVTGGKTAEGTESFRLPADMVEVLSGLVRSTIKAASIERPTWMDTAFTQPEGDDPFLAVYSRLDHTNWTTTVRIADTRYGIQIYIDTFFTDAVAPNPGVDRADLALPRVLTSGMLVTNEVDTAKPDQSIVTTWRTQQGVVFRKKTFDPELGAVRDYGHMALKTEDYLLAKGSFDYMQQCAPGGKLPEKTFTDMTRPRPVASPERRPAGPTSAAVREQAYQTVVVTKDYVVAAYNSAWTYYKNWRAGK